MAMNPWLMGELMAQRSAEMQRTASRSEMARQARPPKHAVKPGRVARRTGRILMNVGWRLAGPEALPVALRH